MQFWTSNLRVESKKSTYSVPKDGLGHSDFSSRSLWGLDNAWLTNLNMNEWVVSMLCIYAYKSYIHQSTSCPFFPYAAYVWWQLVSEVPTTPSLRLVDDDPWGPSIRFPSMFSVNHQWPRKKPTFSLWNLPWIGGSWNILALNIAHPTRDTSRSQGSGHHRNPPGVQCQVAILQNVTMRNSIWHS